MVATVSRCYGDQTAKAHAAGLILSMHAEEQYAVRAFKAGASGYINKASPGEELRRAILKIVKGGQYVGPSLAEKIVLQLTRPEQLPHETPLGS